MLCESPGWVRINHPSISNVAPVATALAVEQVSEERDSDTGYLPFEIGNALTAMLKKGSLQASEVASSWEIVQQIPVDLRSINMKSALKIAVKFNIYAYDAYFLECANSLRSPLLTLDRGMKRIAKEMGIALLE